MGHSVDKEWAGWLHSELQSIPRHLNGDQPRVAFLRCQNCDNHLVWWHWHWIECSLSSTELCDGTCWREGRTSRETWTCWSMQTSWNSTRPSARSCTWVRAVPIPSTGWEENALGRRCGGAGVRKAQHDLSMCTHSPESQTCPGLHCKDKGLLEQVKRRPQRCLEGWSTSAMRKAERLGSSDWRRLWGDLKEPSST